MYMYSRKVFILFATHATTNCSKQFAHVPSLSHTNCDFCNLLNHIQNNYKSILESFQSVQSLIIYASQIFKQIMRKLFLIHLLINSYTFLILSFCPTVRRVLKVNFCKTLNLSDVSV